MKTLGGIVMAIGFLVTVGGVGTDDYQTQNLVPAGSLTPLSQILLVVGIGMAIFIIGFATFKAGERRARFTGYKNHFRKLS